MRLARGEMERPPVAGGAHPGAGGNGRPRGCRVVLSSGAVMAGSVTATPILAGRPEGRMMYLNQGRGTPVVGRGCATIPLCPHSGQATATLS
jgi:hypothetical protein